MELNIWLIRTVDVETETVKEAGSSSADGTDADAVAQAAEYALKDVGITLGPQVPNRIAPRFEQDPLFDLRELSNGFLAK